MGYLNKNVSRFNLLYSKILLAGIKFIYRVQYNKLLKLHPNNNASLEKEFVNKWKPICKNPHIKSYRLFSQYIGPNPNIVPEDISATIIQPILNPPETRPFYQDKNSFEKILPKDYLPITLLRCINGTLLDADYTKINISDGWVTDKILTENKVFLKPSTDTNSGIGVECFSKINNSLREKESGKILSAQYIQEYANRYQNFILQKALTQSPYISQFNPTSINTLRICTYKSIKDDSVHITGIIMRIGKNGAIIDNAHGGGMFIGVDLNGHLGKCVFDQFGNKSNIFNNIDFSKNDFIIPDFERVKDFAVSVGKNILHHRLVAQDICIENDGTPKLVEFNLRGFAPWIFQYAVGPALGNYTDEIIEYCEKHIKNRNVVFTEPY